MYMQVSMTVLHVVPHACCVLQAVEVWFGLSDTSEVVQLSPSLLRKLSSSARVPTLLSQSLTVEFDEGGVLNLVRVTVERVMVVIGDGLKLGSVISRFCATEFSKSRKLGCAILKLHKLDQAILKFVCNFAISNLRSTIRNCINLQIARKIYII